MELSTQHIQFKTNLVGIKKRLFVIQQKAGLLLRNGQMRDGERQFGTKNEENFRALG